MSKQELETIAHAMVAKGKGILAADESAGTIKRRFDGIKIESNEKNSPGLPRHAAYDERHRRSD
jgi:fructose-bisphosphate aldolase class I